MEFYNKYLRNSSETYISKIIFINNLDYKKSIISKELFYITFNKSCKDGFFIDKNNYLHNLTNSYRLGKNLNELSEGYINNIQRAYNYYSYIKVIDDRQNPQLNGKLMLFKYSRSIYFKIINLNEIEFKYIFNLVIKDKYGFNDFSESNFTTSYKKEIMEFDIEKHLSFEIFNIKKITRTDKLKKLNEI